MFQSRQLVSATEQLRKCSGAVSVPEQLVSLSEQLVSVIEQVQNCSRAVSVSGLVSLLEQLGKCSNQRSYESAPEQ